MLLRILELRFPTLVARAFADDTAAVSEALATEADSIMRTFQEYGSMSGLHLNLQKTVVIPLADVDPAAWGDRFTAAHPSWTGVQFATWATYLGFAVGPGKADHSWDKANTKLV